MLRWTRGRFIPWLRCFVVTWLIFCLVFTIGCRKIGSEAEYSKAIEQSSQYINELRERFELPGIAVAVSVNDSIVWEQGFGYANVEKKILVTPETMFRVASVSKVLTAGAVALLHEQGKLDLDAPIQKYVPEFPKKRYPITTRQLAGHLSGIRNYRIDEREDKKHYDDVIKALDLFKDDSLEHTPGTRYTYSGYGWNLISAIVQRASGKPFLQYMRETVFLPLGMSNTVADDITVDIPNRPTFYIGPAEVAPAIDVSYKWASGGFLSTVEDLVRFGSAFLPGSDFLKQETKELLFTNQKTNDGKAVIHGLGWVVQRFENGKPLYHHPGSMIGGQAILVVQPEDRIVVAILANRSGGFGESAANQIACYFLGLDEDECPEIEGEKKRRIEKVERLQIVGSLIAQWKNGIEASDLKKIMATYSENFHSSEWKDKRAMMEHLRQVFASGKTTVDDENLHLRFQTRGYPMGALTYVEGIKTTKPFGPYSIRFTLIREEEGTMITNLEVVQEDRQN